MKLFNKNPVSFPLIHCQRVDVNSNNIRSVLYQMIYRKNSKCFNPPGKSVAKKLGNQTTTNSFCTRFWLIPILILCKSNRINFQKYRSILMDLIFYGRFSIFNFVEVKLIIASMARGFNYGDWNYVENYGNVFYFCCIGTRLIEEMFTLLMSKALTDSLMGVAFFSLRFLRIQ